MVYAVPKTTKQERPNNGKTPLSGSVNVKNRRTIFNLIHTSKNERISLPLPQIRKIGNHSTGEERKEDSMLSIISLNPLDM